MSSESKSQDKPWFQDWRSGCEKQTHYFVRIRKLQDELIHREQHNLINAMERLKQISYPGRKPCAGNPEITDLPPSSHSFPSRPLNLRKQAKHKAIPRHEKPDLKPVAGKPLMPGSERKSRELGHPPFFVVPLLTDTDIAKIVYNVHSSFPREPSTYLLQPHLPSIPNAGRKVNFVLDNRLKLLTLAGDSEFNEGNITGTTKEIHKNKSKKKEGRGSSGRKLKPDNHSETKKRGKGKRVLTFDVDPDDPTVFSHCVDSSNELEEDMTTPLPPPNSRPSSAARVKLSHLPGSVGSVGINEDGRKVTNEESEVERSVDIKPIEYQEHGISLPQESGEEKGDVEQSEKERIFMTTEQPEGMVEQSLENREQSVEEVEQSAENTKQSLENAEQSAENTKQSAENTEQSEEKAENLVKSEELVVAAQEELSSNITGS